jgi:multiple sugar transport system permease protein
MALTVDAGSNRQSRSRDIAGRQRRAVRLRRALSYENPSFGYLLNAPAIFAIGLLVAYPIIDSAWISLHHYNLMQPRAFAFVGLANFAAILASREFWAALVVTAEFTGLALVLLTLLGVGGALLLSAPFPGRTALRLLILIPWAIPPVVNGLMWQWIYDPKVGVLNGLLKALGLIRHYQGWLSAPAGALIALVSAHVWSMFPLAVILLLGALARIPDELYDAARIDGSGELGLFRHVTLPWLAQPLLVVLIIETMYALHAFDVIYVLTSGGPGTATTTLTWQTFLTTFENLNFGRGDAYAWLISLITVGLSAVYFQALYHRGEFEA